MSAQNISSKGIIQAAYNAEFSLGNVSLSPGAGFDQIISDSKSVLMEKIAFIRDSFRIRKTLEAQEEALLESQSEEKEDLLKLKEELKKCDETIEQLREETETLFQEMKDYEAGSDYEKVVKQICDITTPFFKLCDDYLNEAHKKD